MFRSLAIQRTESMGQTNGQRDHLMNHTGDTGHHFNLTPTLSLEGDFVTNAKLIHGETFNLPDIPMYKTVCRYYIRR